MRKNSLAGGFLKTRTAMNSFLRDFVEKLGVLFGSLTQDSSRGCHGFFERVFSKKKKTRIGAEQFFIFYFLFFFMKEFFWPSF